MDWGDWLGGLALVVVTIASGWFARLTGRVLRNERDIAVLQSHVSETPRLLAEIKDELRGLRADEQLGRKELYSHIDGLRKEFKADLAGKADRPG